MVPCFLNLTLQPAVLSPQRSGASLLPYFAFLSPSFSCICTLFQVPYCVSPLLATLTKTAGVCTNNSRSGTLRCPLANPTPGYFDRATSFFLSAHSAFSVISALNPFLSLSFDFQLWTLNLASLRPIPFLFKLLRTLLHCEKSYPLSFHAILDSSHKTPGGGGGSITRTKRKTAPSRPGRDKFRLSLQGDSQENEGCRRYGAARRGRRKRKKVSGLESRQT